MNYTAGLDVGSTTVKLVLLDDDFPIFFSYRRHLSKIPETVCALLEEAGSNLKGPATPEALRISVTGSAGIGLAQKLGLPFIQEVIACTEAVEKWLPGTDAAIELGGEDSKITFFSGGVEQRMNGVCAGGTGAFIDQMAVLIGTDAQGVNRLAKDYRTLYPIASRCGVFAKSDVQPLLNQGADRADIAASILQAVVNQTITGLAAGRKINGRVVYLGGPLYFLSELRTFFTRTLGLDDPVLPDNALHFVALGAALLSSEVPAIRFHTLAARLNSLSGGLRVLSPGIEALPPLFKNDEEFYRFKERHAGASIKQGDLASFSGPLFLGLDAGSTTTKAVLTDLDGTVRFSRYENHQGKPLDSALGALKDIYAKLSGGAYIARAAVVGYGEKLVQNGLKFDIGEVETAAHYKAADALYPGVDFIIDIGGQDMKVMRLKNGALSSILLNEACSAGCGSFIENFSKALHFKTIEDFVSLSLRAKQPADLGIKCTVFMNSQVKQAQKDGAGTDDIAAGLAYSIVKNALYKVIKMRSPDDLGERIVCQGGTFYNDAILRAFEIISGHEVIRPSIAGLMGAYGASLVARDDWKEGKKSSVLSAAALDTFKTEIKTTHCGGCENRCLLTVTSFPDGTKNISGNRCERGVDPGAQQGGGKVNLADYKYERLFACSPLSSEKAMRESSNKVSCGTSRGKIGVPRALNLYDNYPLWFTFLSELGFEVVLSPPSSKTLYEKGIQSIPADTVCYPAKLSHGHIHSLVESGLKTIFFPSVVLERRETEVEYHYNCPIIMGYPVIIKNNIEEIKNGEARLLTPTLDIEDRNRTAKELLETFKDFGIGEEEIKAALDKGYEEQDAFRQDMKDRGDALLAQMKKEGSRGIVLAGRPYHTDPEINHGISALIAREGFHVLTEDSIFHLGEVEEYRINNKWTYDTRVFLAAQIAAKTENLELVLLNSFGCVTDSITLEQVEEILKEKGKSCTILRIDEIANLGMAGIRIRSLKAALKEKDRIRQKEKAAFVRNDRVYFVKNMKKRHTILIPAMYPFREKLYFDIAFAEEGYKCEYLTFELGAAEIGIKYVNNDFCHTVFDYIGQIYRVLKSGKYNPDEVSVMMFDSLECPCRGSNFGPVIRKALNDMGYPQIPIVAYMGKYKDFKKFGEQTGLTLTESLKMRFLLAHSYGDLFERLIPRTRPYEKTPGQIDRLHEIWRQRTAENMKEASMERFNADMKEMIREFDETPLDESEERPKIGMVGDTDIPLDFGLSGDNNMIRLLESEGAEAVIPGYGFTGTMNLIEMGEEENAKVYWDLVDHASDMELRRSTRFRHLYSIFDMQESAREMAPFAYYNNNFYFAMGGRIIELLKDGVDNIINFQSFNCTLNYISGIGLVKEIKNRYPGASILDIDYAPGIPQVNQLNRIRLLLARARKAMKIKVEV
jgi:predicted CoA-substrate-specific enzyme activase